MLDLDALEHLDAMLSDTAESAAKPAKTPERRQAVPVLAQCPHLRAKELLGA